LSGCPFCKNIKKGSNMLSMGRIATVMGLVLALTACTGHVQNTKNNCSYDYFLHPSVSISKMIGGCGPAATQVEAKN
jgi:hypothetical protein